MTESLASFTSLALGDLITLPDGRVLPIRALEQQFAHDVGPLRGFALLGEIGPECMMLAIPTAVGTPLPVYSPLKDVPAGTPALREIISGVVSYWPPHLPGYKAAMGELGYKVFAVRGTVDPLIMMWRGRELVVFVKSGTVDPSSILVEHLSRKSGVDPQIRRYAATVTNPSSATGIEEELGSYEVALPLPNKK